MLAGAVTEELLLGSRSTGASGDYQQAVKLARRYVVAGMSALGIVDPDTLDKKDLARAQQELLAEVERGVSEFLQTQLVWCNRLLRSCNSRSI